MFTKFDTQRAVVIIVLLFSLVSLSNCDEAEVGAPCKPETDKGEYREALTSDIYAIETRSVQCKTSICITKTQVLDTQTGLQNKYSFCSCRCADETGKEFDKNNDKLDDLCECPGGSICSNKVVANNIEDIPPALKGSYCLPACIENVCPQTSQKCTPPDDSKEPWKWECKIASQK